MKARLLVARAVRLKTCAPLARCLSTRTGAGSYLHELKLAEAAQNSAASKAAV
jgi:hypothetical protein|eukprot:COSAG01_NODE_3931_length_5524_cov_20.370507_2_plen_53_part_00